MSEQKRKKERRKGEREREKGSTLSATPSLRDRLADSLIHICCKPERSQVQSLRFGHFGIPGERVGRGSEAERDRAGNFGVVPTYFLDLLKKNEIKTRATKFN